MNNAVETKVSVAGRPDSENLQTHKSFNVLLLVINANIAVPSRKRAVSSINASAGPEQLAEILSDTRPSTVREYI